MIDFMWQFSLKAPRKTSPVPLPNAVAAVPPPYASAEKRTDDGGASSPALIRA